MARYKFQFFQKEVRVVYAVLQGSLTNTHLKDDEINLNFNKKIPFVQPVNVYVNSPQLTTPNG